MELFAAYLCQLVKRLKGTGDSMCTIDGDRQANDRDAYDKRHAEPLDVFLDISDGIFGQIWCFSGFRGTFDLSKFFMTI